MQQNTSSFQRLRRGISSTISLEVEKSPLAALVNVDPGQLPTIRVMWRAPLDMGRSPDSKHTPVRVVGTKISTGVDDTIDVSIDS